jgi:hypothetical protein
MFRIPPPKHSVGLFSSTLAPRRFFFHSTGSSIYLPTDSPVPRRPWLFTDPILSLISRGLLWFITSSHAQRRRRRHRRRHHHRIQVLATQAPPGRDAAAVAVEVDPVILSLADQIKGSSLCSGAPRHISPSSSEHESRIPRHQRQSISTPGSSD